MGRDLSFLKPRAKPDKPQGKVIAIDFDGVIHDYHHPVPGKRMGPPIQDAERALNQFRARGDTLIVFSTWGGDSGRQTIADWMNYYHLPFDEITNIKPQAAYYIDDKAIHFDTWELTLEKIHD